MEFEAGGVVLDSRPSSTHWYQRFRLAWVVGNTDGESLGRQRMKQSGLGKGRGYQRSGLGVGNTDVECSSSKSDGKEGAV